MSYEGLLYVPPSNTSFTNLNFITGATVSTVGNQLDFFSPSKSGNNVVGQYVAAPATPYCTIAKIVNNQGDYVSASYTNTTMTYGLGFYDGTKLVAMQASYSNTITMSLRVNTFATTTSTPTTVFGQDYADGQGLISWFQIRDDGTNIYFYVAMDDGETQPTHWVKLYQQARTSFLTAVTNVCYMINATGGAADNNNYLTIQSWQTVAL
jgi:hypothetical protein